MRNPILSFALLTSTFISVSAFAADTCRYPGLPDCKLPDINDARYGMITACLTKDSGKICKHNQLANIDYPLQIQDLAGNRLPAVGCYNEKFEMRKDPLPNGKCPDLNPFRVSLPFASYCKSGKDCTSGGFLVVQPKIEAPDRFDLTRLQIFQPIVVSTDADTLQTTMDICASQEGREWKADQNACVKTTAFKQSVCESLGHVWIAGGPSGGRCATQCAITSCTDSGTRCAGYQYIPDDKACLCKGTSLAKDKFGMSCKSNPTTIEHFQLGLTHACYIQNKKVYCFGDNGGGTWSNNLGQGGNKDQFYPGVVQVKGLSNVKTIEMQPHSQITCAVTESGRIALWGQPGWGTQLGNGEYEEAGNPEGKTGKLRTQTSITTAVACGSSRYATYAILADGTVKAWGQGYTGLLGIDPNNIPKVTYGDQTFMETTEPVTVLDSDNNILNDVKQVTGTAAATCALKNNGDVYCWGNNKASDLAAICASGGGDCYGPTVGVTDSSGNVIDQIIWKATKVRGLENVKQIRGSYDEFCAVTNDGKTYCWGLKPQLVADIPAGKTVSPYANPTKVLPYFGARCVLKDDNVMCSTHPHMKDNHKMNGYSYMAGTPYQAEYVPIPTDAKKADVPTANDLAVGHIWACSVHAGDCKVRCWGSGWDRNQGSAIANIGPTPMVIDGADACK